MKLVSFLKEGEVREVSKQIDKFEIKNQEEAEKITKQHGFNKLSIISGIGVRRYFYKLGYSLEDTYVTKQL